MPGSSAKSRKNRRRRVILRDGFDCWLCGEACVGGDKTLDHIVPASCGGAHGFENLFLAHEKCNNERRNDITPIIPALVLHYFLECA
jgi:5-methylcytosine-specific restriction endonuclease McrA